MGKGLVRSFLAVSSIVLLMSCAQAGKRDSLVTVYEGLVEVLGDSSLPMARRETAQLMLCLGRKDVIPVLIAALQDSRVFNPAFRGPSASPEDKPRVLTVGNVCEEILYSIITGEELRKYRVQDWSAWWEKHKSKSLGEIVEMVRRDSELQKQPLSESQK